MDNKDLKAASVITQDSILPSTIKQRHLVASPTQVGDLYYGLGGNFGNLKIGTVNQILTVVNGIPAWKTVNPSVITKLGTVTSSFATASNSFVDVTGASISITTAVSCNIYVVFSGDWLSNGTHFNYLQLLRGTTVLAQNIDYQDTAAVQHIFSMSHLDLAVAAGTYTYKAQMKVDAGTGTISGAAAGGENSRFIVMALPA